MRKKTTNNVIRLLEKRKIAFQAFELPAEKLSAVETAHYLQVPAEHVYKTLVARPSEGKLILAVVPGSKEVDLKALARAVGVKKVKLVTQREAEQLTGLQVGGISPLALIHRGFRVVVDDDASRLESLHISGGQRGLNIRLPVKDLLHLTGALIAPIERPTGEGS
jgi:Cys-tRNA(Pro)/Cys-tRNA(Cys) deacylase